MGWLEILFGFLGAIGLYIARQYWEEYKFQQFARENGCKPTHQESDKVFWGLDRFYQVMKIMRNGGDLLEDIVVPRFSEDGVFKRSREGEGLFGQMVLNTIEPRNIQTVMALKFNDYEVGERRHGSFRPLLGNNIFTSDGAFWEHSRALLRPQFARENINNLKSAEYNVQALFKTIPEREDGWTEQIELQERFYRLTLDGASEFFFNDNVNSQLAAAGMAPKSSDAAGNMAADQDESEFTFAEAFNTAQEWMGFRFRLQGLYWLGDSPKFRRACKHVRRFVEGAIHRVLTSGKAHTSKSGYSLLGSLSKDTQDVTELRDQCLGMLLAGRDTTASLLGWLFTVFINHPHVFHKLRKAILEEFDPNKNDEITFAKLKGCRYLQWTINETLRMHPPIPLNSRQAVRNTVLPLGGGPDEKSPVAIRKGQHVFFAVYAMHRSTDVWGPDAKEFKPERWENRKMDWSFLPFSGGPRVCIGRK
jgi:cytochrome P450